jgi:uncharacterized protein
MKENSEKEIAELYLNYLRNKNFPCVAAREAAAREQIPIFVAGHMACPRDDSSILNFIYSFVDEFREKTDVFHSAAVIFKLPEIQDEQLFDNFMWQRLQALSDLDATKYRYDERVDADPNSENFSFSLKEEAFFVVGLHPNSSRLARQFAYPVLTFNPHALFVKLKEAEQYSKMKNIVRKRDLAYAGSVNPMLDEYGLSSEVYQYSGRQYNNDWQCPFKYKHATITNDFATQWNGISIEERSTPKGR